MKKILLSIFIFTAITTNAQNLFQDNFSGYTVDQNLNGQGSWTNNSSNGGYGSCFGVACTLSQVKTNSISYLGYGSSNKAVKINGLGQGDAPGKVFADINSGVFYVSFVVNFTNTTNNNNNYEFFIVGNNLGFEKTFRVGAKSAGGGSFYLGVGKNSISWVTTNSYSYGSDHLVVFKYTINPGTNDDTINMYVDPTFANGVPTIADFSTSSGTDASSAIKRVAINDFLTTGNNGHIGLVSVARTWADLSFNLSNSEFNKNTFTIASNQVSNGVLSIKASTSLDNATLNIFDIQGRKVETKTISLQETVNDVAINPIKNTGVYIVEILSSTNQRFTQKIMVN